MHLFEQFTQTSFTVGFGAADGFFDPSVDVQMVRLAELSNLKSLVFDRLLVGTYANISINHAQKYAFSCICQNFCVNLQPNSMNMAKYIVMAEEGERVLLDKARAELGLDLSDAELIFTGVGAINIIRSLQHLDREAELFNIGYAGSANFDLGTWVKVNEVRLNHPNVTYSEPKLPLVELKIKNEKLKQAVCYSNCDFVLASDYRDCVFDMELAFIAALGFKNLHSLKYVSDNLSLHAYHDLTHGVE